MHDAKGEARLELPPLPAGAWRIHYETRDEFGGVRRVDQDFLVAGSRMPVKLPGVIRVERESVAVGQDARILAFSGLPGQIIFLETLSAGRVDRSRTLYGRRRQPDRNARGREGPWRVRGPPVARQRPPARDGQRPHSGSVERQGAPVSFATFRDRIRPGHEGNLARDGEGAFGSAVEAGCRGTARLHVRPEPRRVRRALSAQSALALPGPRPGRLLRSSLGESRRPLGVRQRLRVPAVAGEPARRSAEIPRRVRHRRPRDRGAG